MNQDKINLIVSDLASYYHEMMDGTQGMSSKLSTVMRGYHADNEYMKELDDACFRVSTMMMFEEEYTEEVISKLIADLERLAEKYKDKELSTLANRFKEASAIS